MGPLTFALVRILADKTRARNVTERAELARRIGVMRELFPDVWDLLQAPLDAGELVAIQTEAWVDPIAVYSVKLNGGRVKLCIDGSVIDRDTGLVIARQTDSIERAHLVRVGVAMGTIDQSDDPHERANAMLTILALGGAVRSPIAVAEA